MGTEDKIPSHVAIIMDGNGRWAKARHLPRTQGHAEGVKRVEEIIIQAHGLGIKVLTLYAFSTENWARPAEEVSMLMRLFIMVLSSRVKDLSEQGIQLRFIGRRIGIPPEVLKAIEEAEAITRHNTELVVNIAFNYGSRAEIVDAVKCVGNDLLESKMTVDQIDESKISQYLYTSNQPEVDLLIRTSGEQRISNFLLWQLSYAEFYFTSIFWPEFNSVEFDNAIKEYSRRHRRYGGVYA